MPKIGLGLVLIFALVLSLPEKAHDGCVNDFLFSLLVRSLCFFPNAVAIRLSHPPEHGGRGGRNGGRGRGSGRDGRYVRAGNFGVFGGCLRLGASMLTNVWHT